MYNQIHAAATFIREKLNLKADEPAGRIGVILGSGLGPFADKVSVNTKENAISYHDIPGFPTSSVVGHRSQFMRGLVEGHQVLIMQGRVHRYEGYNAAQVAFPAQVLIALGARAVILTNASGAIHNNFNVGDLMLMSDHINLTGDNPLLGANDLRLGPRFFDMSECYTPALRDLAKHLAATLHIPLQEGVYAGVLGPSYETPAEIRAFRTLGADAVGMSTIFEAIAAHHGGAEVLGISCLTNKAAGLSAQKLSHDDVTVIANQASDRLSSLLLHLIPELAKRYEQHD